MDDSTAIRSTCLVFATTPKPETNQADAIRLEVRGGEEDSYLGVAK